MNNEHIFTSIPIWISLTFYFLALFMTVVKRSKDGFRFCWSLGLGFYLLHVIAAFHFHHHWSHLIAREHVRQESGVADGIYVNYLFTLVWSGDVLWSWLASKRYAKRQIGVGVALHVFLGFIVFNAAVVFETGVVRWASVCAFGLLALLFWKRKFTS